MKKCGPKAKILQIYPMGRFLCGDGIFLKKLQKKCYTSVFGAYIPSIKGRTDSEKKLFFEKSPSTEIFFADIPAEGARADSERKNPKK